MNYKRIKEEFDSLTERGQWNYAMGVSDKISLFIDNDSTGFTFIEDNSGDGELFYFKDDIGNRAGVEHLLAIVGFKFCRA